MDERELIKLIQEKDDIDALDELTESYRGMAHVVVRKYANKFDKLPYEDLLIESLLEVQRAAMTYKLDSNVHFKTYLYTIMRNRVLGLIRSSKAQKRDTGDLNYFESNIGNGTLKYQDILCEAPTQHYEIERQESLKNIKNFLYLVLSPIEADIYLCWLNTSSIEEVEKLTHLDRKKTKNKLAYIRRKLKKNKEIYIKNII